MVQAESQTGESSSINTRRRITMEMSVGEASSTYPGFRFSPTDEELIQCYLRKKLRSSNENVEIIAEVDICRHEPWDLPAESIIPSDKEWFFFYTRGRKYPSGSQNRRATRMGYWKATVKERTVKLNGNIIGTKRTLVFHLGRAPRGQRTEWIMHEFCTAEQHEEGMVVCRLRKNEEFHLNDNTGRDSRDESAITINTDNTGRDSRDESAININTALLSGGELSQMEGIQLETISPRDCDSSYNSHSVEQLPSEEHPVSEESDNKFATQFLEGSDEKIATEFFHHGSPSLTKTHIEEEQSYMDKEEDDCYTDIMRDDIIKLDDKNLGDDLNSQIKRTTSGKEIPSQGTANRRIRLRRRMSLRRKPYKFEDEVIATEYKRSFIPKIKYPSIFLLSLILLVGAVVVGWNSFHVLGYAPILMDVGSERYG